MSSVQQGESSLLRLGNTVFLFNLPQRNNPIPSRLFFELLSYMIIFDPADGLSLYYFSKSWHFTAASHLTFMLFSLMPFGMFVTCPLSFLGTRLEQSNAAISRCHIYTIEHKKNNKEETDAGFSKLIPGQIRELFLSDICSLSRFMGVSIILFLTRHRQHDHIIFIF